MSDKETLLPGTFLVWLLIDWWWKSWLCFLYCFWISLLRLCLFWSHFSQRLIHSPGSECHSLVPHSFNHLFSSPSFMILVILLAPSHLHGNTFKSLWKLFKNTNSWYVLLSWKNCWCTFTLRHHRLSSVPILPIFSPETPVIHCLMDSLGSYFISLPRSRWHSWQLPPSWHKFVFHFSLCTLSWFSFNVSGCSFYYVLWAHFLQLVFSLLLFLRVLFPRCSPHEIFLAAFDVHHLSMSWLPSGNLQVPSLSLTVLKTWHEGVPQRPKGYWCPRLSTETCLPLGFSFCGWALLPS